MTAQEYIAHVEKAFEMAENNQSNISQEIIDMEGMTGTKTRHLYNNLLNMPDARYLEIGVWKGSSCISALYKNMVLACLMDDFSSFGSPREEFYSNFKKHLNGHDAAFFEHDCFTFDINRFDMKFNLYLFDGDHSHESQRKGLEYYLPAMDNTFIFIVDDWNLETARTGTLQAIKDNNLNIIFQKEIFTEGHDAKGFWAGVSVFILQK